MTKLDKQGYVGSDRLLLWPKLQDSYVNQGLEDVLEYKVVLGGVTQHPAVYTIYWAVCFPYFFWLSRIRKLQLVALAKELEHYLACSYLKEYFHREQVLLEELPSLAEEVSALAGCGIKEQFASATKVYFLLG